LSKEDAEKKFEELSKIITSLSIKVVNDNVHIHQDDPKKVV
jgi:hypothetical protein